MSEEPQLDESQATETVSAPESTGAESLLSGKTPANPLDSIFQEGILDKLPDGPNKEWLRKQKSGDGLLNAINGLRSLSGRKDPGPLPEDATEEMRAEHEKILRKMKGIPEKVDDYAFNLPEGWDMPDETQAAIRQFAFENGVEPKVIEQFLPFQLELTKKANEMATQKHLENQMEKAGELFGGKDKFNAIAPELRKLADESGFDVVEDMAFRHASTWKLVDQVRELQTRIAQMTGEDRSVKGGNVVTTSSADVQSRLDKMLYDKSSMEYQALHNVGHPENRRISKEYTELNKRLFELTHL